MNEQEISALVFTLFAAFPQAEGKQTRERLRVYCEMLRDLDNAAAQSAVARLIQSSKFLPTIAEVREAARQVERGQRRTGIEAWGDVVSAIRTIGSYRVPVFADPYVTRAVAALTWKECCLGDNEASIRARFVEAYEAMSDREEREMTIAEPLRLAPPRGGSAALGSVLATALLNARATNEPASERRLLAVNGGDRDRR